MKKKNPKTIEIILRAIIVSRGKILLCVSNDKPPIHYLPGGHLEKGETICKSLKRELKEEVGAKIKSVKFLNFFENFFRQKGRFHHEINFLYRVFLKNKNPRKLKCRENHINITWLPIKKIPQSKLLPPNIWKYLIKYFRK